MKMLKRAETMLFRQPLQLKKPAADDRKMKEVPKPISTRLDEGMIFGMNCQCISSLFSVANPVIFEAVQNLESVMIDR